MKNSVPGRSADLLGDDTPLLGRSKVIISELTVAAALTGEVESNKKS